MLFALALSNLSNDSTTRSWGYEIESANTCLASFLLRVLHEFHNSSSVYFAIIQASHAAPDGTSFGKRAINEVEKWLKAVLCPQARTSLVLGSTWIKEDGYASAKARIHFRRNVGMVKGLSIVLANDRRPRNIINLASDVSQNDEKFSPRFYLTRPVTCATIRTSESAVSTCP